MLIPTSAICTISTNGTLPECRLAIVRHLLFFMSTRSKWQVWIAMQPMHMMWCCDVIRRFGNICAFVEMWSDFTILPRKYEMSSTPCATTNALLTSYIYNSYRQDLIWAFHNLNCQCVLQFKVHARYTIVPSNMYVCMYVQMYSSGRMRTYKHIHAYIRGRMHAIAKSTTLNVDISMSTIMSTCTLVVEKVFVHVHTLFWHHI